MHGVDKLDQDLGGRPVLRWSIEAMLAASSVGGLVVVLPAEQIEHGTFAPWLASLGARLVPGGARRQDSVAAGVRASAAEVVLVHDGARPFVDPAVVDAVAGAARHEGAAIPVLPLVDSLKRVEGGRISGTAPRDGLYRAQTPQAARRDILAAALDLLAAGDELFGDEAELLARYGVPVATVAGDPSNLKLTVPSDLDLARALVDGRAGRFRAGAGFDSHPFGPETGLWLGGIELANAPRLAGHSDGDVALHAVCDALLGAAGLPDLGRAFPASDPATRGVAGVELVRAVLAQVERAGWRPASVDVTITGARPRLGGTRLDAMRTAIAGMLGLESGAVAVKASSGNLSGDDGAGRAMSAAAIVGLVRG